MGEYGLSDADICGAIAELADRVSASQAVIDSLVDMGQGADEDAALTDAQASDEVLRLSVAAPHLFSDPETARAIGPRRPSREAAAVRADAIFAASAASRRPSQAQREAARTDREIARLTHTPALAKMFEDFDPAYVALSVVGGVAISAAAAARGGYSPEQIAELARRTPPTKPRPYNSGNPSNLVGGPPYGTPDDEDELDPEDLLDQGYDEDTEDPEDQGYEGYDGHGDHSRNDPSAEGIDLDTAYAHQGEASLEVQRMVDQHKSIFTHPAGSKPKRKSRLPRTPSRMG